MDEVVCISSEDEMKVEDIVEVFEEVCLYFVVNSQNRVDIRCSNDSHFLQVTHALLFLQPLEDAEGDFPLLPDPFTLEGFVQPEDLGMHGRPFQPETKESTIINGIQQACPG